jgi:hypothetical protein
MADDEASDMVLIDAQLPDDETWMRLNTRRRQLRHDLLDAARRDLGLGRAKIIHPGRGHAGTRALRRLLPLRSIHPSVP